MEDVTANIQRKIWTANEFLSQLKDIEEDACQLSSKEKKGIPIFSGDWTEETVKKYLKELEKSVKHPIRYKNKEKMEEIGVKTEKLPEDIFKNTHGISNILKSFEEIKDINENINAILISEGLLLNWLKEGINEANEKLKKIVSAKPAFNRFLGSEVDEKLKSDLLKKSAKDINFLSKAEDIIRSFASLCDYGIILDNGELSYEHLDKAYYKIQQIQEDYGLSGEEIKELVEGKTLIKANEFLEQKDKEYAENKRKLLEEWRMCASTLELVAEEVTEPPESLKELEEAVECLRKKCLKSLGDAGLKLLKFLKGEDDFPASVDMDEIKLALETLRPFISKSLMEES